MFKLRSKPVARLVAILAAGLMLVLAPVVQAEWFNQILTIISQNGVELWFFFSSPDSQSVVYRADADVNDQYELYSVPITGGVVKKLSGVMVNGGDIGSLTYLPIDRIIYMADQEVDEQTELFSVSYAAGPATQLNGNLITEGDVRGWSLSADYAYLVYSADQETDEIIELYQVPLSGGVASKLNLPLLPGDSVKQWSLSSALDEVVYTTQFSSNPGPQVDLYRVPIAGGDVLTLTLPLTTGQTLISITYDPTGNRLIYQAGSFPFGRLYSIKLDGSDVQPLSAGTIYPNWGFSRDSQQVIYRSGSPLALYAVPVAGGTAIKLSADGGGDILEWKLSPDGSRIVYWAYFTGSGGDKGLYSVALAGGPVNPLHTAPVRIYSQSHFQITPDGTQVVYLGDGYKLYVVPILGGTPAPLTEPMPGDFRINPGGSAVIFTDDLDTLGKVELYSVPLTGGSPGKLNRPLLANESVGFFALTLNGQAVVYKVTGANYIELDVAYQLEYIYLPVILR